MRLKKFVIRGTLILVGIVVLTTILLLALGIDSTPLVERQEELSEQDIARIKQQWEQYDPRTMLPGQIKHIVVTERDINLLFAYAASRIVPEKKVNVRIELYPDSTFLWATVPLPSTIFGGYLNIFLKGSLYTGDITLTQLRVGRVPIPRWFGKVLLRSAYQRFQQQDARYEIEDVLQALRQIRVQNGRMLLTYHWQPEMMGTLVSQGQSLFFSEDDITRLEYYNDRLTELAQSWETHPVSIIALMQPLFQFAQQRSLSGNAPEVENRMVLLLAALYVSDIWIGDVFDHEDAFLYRRPAAVPVTLLNRGDLAQHFLTSAAVAASTDSHTAEVLGLFKEANDSRGGSSFSFADLAADQAGIRLAEAATGSPQQAQQFQDRIQRISQENAMMPSVQELPEGLQALDMEIRYGEIDSAAYHNVYQEIERRLATCWLYD
jgi:hypothetical protein